MKTDLQTLQDQITPEVLGIFWITEQELKKQPRPFHAIDYFLDGILTTTTSTSPSKKNFFISKGFDQTFFVGHIQKNLPNLQKEMEDLMKLIEALNVSQKKILVIDDESDKNLNYLSKKYSKFTYKRIELGESNDISHP